MDQGSDGCLHMFSRTDRDYSGDTHAFEYVAPNGIARFGKLTLILSILSESDGGVIIVEKANVIWHR